MSVHIFKDVVIEQEIPLEFDYEVELEFSLEEIGDMVEEVGLEELIESGDIELSSVAAVFKANTALKNKLLAYASIAELARALQSRLERLALNEI